MIIPNNIPICDMACGMASVPAPTMVLRRLMLLLSMEACPPPSLGLRPRFGLPAHIRLAGRSGSHWVKRTMKRSWLPNMGLCGHEGSWASQPGVATGGGQREKIMTYRAIFPASEPDPLPLENVE